MRSKKNITRFLLCLAAVMFLWIVLPVKASASGDLDEIINYEITAVVNDDATVRLNYHIDWKVLDSDSDGPLSWVKIGIPNKHCSDIKALSGNIKDIGYLSDSGSYVKITFDRNYYKDEIVSFDFALTQDYIYEMNLLTDGETVYQFTPGWFDEINVDSLVIHWKGDNTISVTPAAIMDGGYYTWETSLPKGAQFQISVTYPNDAYNFSKDKKVLLVIELKKGRTSDVVVGQIQRYMGYVKDEVLERGQKVKGLIIGLEPDVRLKRALSVCSDIEFCRYKIDFKLIKD